VSHGRAFHGRASQDAALVVRAAFGGDAAFLIFGAKSPTWHSVPRALPTPHSGPPHPPQEPRKSLFSANTYASATPTVCLQARSMPITSSNRSVRVRNLDTGTSKDAVETFAKTLAQTGSGKKVDSLQTPVSTAFYNLCVCAIAQLKQQ